MFQTFDSLMFPTTAPSSNHGAYFQPPTRLVSINQREMVMSTVDMDVEMKVDIESASTGNQSGTQRRPFNLEAYIKMLVSDYLKGLADFVNADPSKIVVSYLIDDIVCLPRFMKNRLENDIVGIYFQEQLDLVHFLENIRCDGMHNSLGYRLLNPQQGTPVASHVRLVDIFVQPKAHEMSCQMQIAAAFPKLIRGSYVADALLIKMKLGGRNFVLCTTDIFNGNWSGGVNGLNTVRMNFLLKNPDPMFRPHRWVHATRLSCANLTNTRHFTTILADRSANDKMFSWFDLLHFMGLANPPSSLWHAMGCNESKNPFFALTCQKMTS